MYKEESNATEHNGKNSIPLCKVNQSGETEPKSFSFEKTGFGATVGKCS